MNELWEGRGELDIWKITHSWALLYRHHWTDYYCKHERQWNGKSIVPNVKRVTGLHSTANQAVSLLLLSAKPATEPEAALRRLTFVYQTMVARSFLHRPSHLALWRITMVTGMLMESCPAISVARHLHQHTHCWSWCLLNAANWQVLLALSTYIPVTTF